ncbi:MAG: lipoprotein insertase outer membrane protein LolB [Pseudomonadota bacterium]
MPFNRHLIVAAGLLLLSSCATTSKPPMAQSPMSQAAHQQHLAKLAQIKSFALKGRLGVVTQKQGFSGGIDWQHAVNTDNVDVYSPVGGKVANISKNATAVILTKQDGRSVTAQDAESLTETALGFKLPLSGLSDWALGKPTTNNINSSTWDENGRLLTLKQDGWDISYENYADNEGVFLPNKIVLKSEKVNLKLLVEKWTDVSKQ